MLLSESRGTNLNPPTLSRDDYQDLKNGRTYVATFGKISFEDLFGVQHWMTFCSWRALKAGQYAARKCTEYNDLDNN